MIFQGRRLLVATIILFFPRVLVLVRGDPNAPETESFRGRHSLRLGHSRFLKDFDMHMVDFPEDLDPDLVTGFVAGAICMLLVLCFLSCCCDCACRSPRENYYYDRRGGYYYHNNNNGGGGGPRWTLCDCLALACIWEICCDRRRGYESF